MAQTFNTLLPVSFDLNEALAYYEELKTNFQHFRWKMPTRAFRKFEDPLYKPAVYGWAIQTPGDINEPHIMLYDAEIGGRENHKETPCAFGFAKKLLDAFPTAFRMYVTVNTPGVEVLPHVDNIVSKKRYRITVPIQTNPDAFWITPEGNVHLDVGKVYLIDWSIRHGTQNNGTTDRVSFMFEVYADDIQTIKETSITI